MISFIKLVRNEHMKIYKKISTLIMIILLILIVIAAGGLMKVSKNLNQTFETGIRWEEDITTENDEIDKQINDPSSTEEEKNTAKIRKEYNDYKINNNIAPDSWKNEPVNEMMNIKLQLAKITDPVLSDELSKQYSIIEGYVVSNDWKTYYTIKRDSLNDQIKETIDEQTKKGIQIQADSIEMRLKYNISPENDASGNNWKNVAIKSIESYRMMILDYDINGSQAKSISIAGMPGAAEMTDEEIKAQVETFRRSVALDTYRIEHDITPINDPFTQWGFMKNIGIGLIGLIAVFIIIVSSLMVAGEFSDGTVKLLLIRPHKRWEILLSKYLTIFIYTAEMIAILLAASYITSGLLFGFEKLPSYIYLSGSSVIEQSIIIRLLFELLLNAVPCVLMFTLAFMMSTVFRNSAVSIGISLFILFFGDALVLLFVNLLKFTWVKYILFANWNIINYFTEGTAPVVKGMTLTFSLIVIAIYFVIFNLITFLTFEKRDIAT